MESEGAWLLLGLVFLVIFIIIPLTVYDSLYVIPRAAERANQYCEEKGYDFYDEYKRIGFFSKEPVAIKCKYVEQYRNVDLSIKKEVENNGN